MILFMYEFVLGEWRKKCPQAPKKNARKKKKKKSDFDFTHTQKK